MTVALRMSQLYAPTLKEDPVEAEVASHRLMLRAGLMRRAAAGIYTFLPLGWRSVHKVQRIVREEMDAIGSQEMLMPIVQPAELWQQSGRWDVYGPELARLTDRQGREFCLGPTHEEIITATVRGELRSYRQLPVSLYQINMKFRDEIRPRFGLLRGREFIMKDAYSFHATQESLKEHYDAMAHAYGRICDRLGLDWRPVEADSGQIGGKVTTEFMALAESGEAGLVYCECGWAANVEAASAVVPYEAAATSAQPLERVATPGVQTIADLADFLGVSGAHTVKTMAATTENGRLVFLCVPGHRELNELKAAGVAPGLELLDDDGFARFGIHRGFLGPVGAPEGTLVVADRTLKAELAWTVGANEPDVHLTGAMPGRDFAVDAWADLVVAEAGDGCPVCGETLRAARGIEVSQVFQLGTKYSESMHATYTAEDGSEQPFIMGCYGVGITRSLAAVIEQHHDEHGIVWPVSVAPAEVAILPLQTGDDLVGPAAERIFAELADAGVEVVIDDRDERAGVKFADADLIGWPMQVVVGKRGVAEGVVELKTRATGERVTLPLDQAVSTVARLVAEARSALA
ncbi:proline--tRNA ligase [Anaerosoma tenue]|uniref:proline--tRNA ligase n=1 Tax=Anaerosoma tenue TaxID=2933588 RepID=UPI002260E5B0|nr:proline--tRNA ligase [Anaerosoma tenue]MCK8114221.1 proline--tRNA ligase [Anaerosoma tenue]